MNFNISIEKSDSIGALASGLCLIHCLATPFLFVAKTCSASCCAAAPSWWKWFDFAFLLIAFFAVYRSARTTSKKWIPYVLWASWTALALILVNEQIQWVSIPHKAIYFPALVLIVTHIYNLKYCQCEGEYCQHNASSDA